MAAVFLAGFWLRAAEPTNAAGVPFKPEIPQVQFSETDFHFGNLAPGETGEHTFYVTNLSTRVVEITNVRADGPGAMLGGEWDRKIQPGGFGRIPVRLRMPGVPHTMPQYLRSSIVKAVRVSFDWPSNSSQVLLIRGTVWAPIAVEPASVEFKSVEGENAEETNSVRIINQMEQPLVLDTPICTNSALRVQLKTITVGKEFDLSVVWSNSLAATVWPSVERHSIFESSVAIKTSNTNLSLFTIPVTVTPKSLLIILSSPVQLERHEIGRGFSSCGFSIYPQGKTPIRFLEASVNTETKRITTTGRPDGSFYVHAMFPFDVPGDQELAFTITTTHPALPKFTVPIKR
jgi:hypothetical protein